VTPSPGRAIMAAVEQLTFGTGPAVAGAAQEALAALGPTPHHRLSWSYLDDLPRWRHLKRHRPDVEGQLSLL
jgi:hypothetical protein